MFKIFIVGIFFVKKLYSNDIMFNICDVESLFKWFAHKFILFHCSSEN